MAGDVETEDQPELPGMPQSHRLVMPDLFRGLRKPARLRRRKKDAMIRDINQAPDWAIGHGAAPTEPRAESKFQRGLFFPQQSDTTTMRHELDALPPFLRGAHWDNLRRMAAIVRQKRRRK